MTEPALLSLSRAAHAIAHASVTATTSPQLGGREVEILLTLAACGPLRHAELAQRVNRSLVQPVTGALRREGLLTLTGSGHSSRLVLDERGIKVVDLIHDALDRRWDVLCRSHGPADAELALSALRELAAAMPAATSSRRSPFDLLTVVTKLKQDVTAHVLRTFYPPGWTEAPVRPMLLMSRGPADTYSLALELGIGRPALNLALTTPRRQGLVRRGPHELVSLTEDGMVAVTQLSELANAPWVTVEQRFGPRAAATTAQIVADLGRGAPARARN